MENVSFLQKARTGYAPKVSKKLQGIETLTFIPSSEEPSRFSSFEELENFFPLTLKQPLLKLSKDETKEHQALKVGIVFSGGPAPGGHNVILGLYDALIRLNKDSQLFGFLDGPKGIVENHLLEITEDLVKEVRNQGGFDLIGTGRTKIETAEQFQKVRGTMNTLELDGLVIIGGDDSNTNAAFLAEDFKHHHLSTSVVGVPKTIDGDLKNQEVETSFGFDTATKVYSEMIGNLLRDSLSQKKYYFFVKVMGRSASHIALECALQTHPNMTLIGEEIEYEGKMFCDIVKEIADLVCHRSEIGKNYGLILIPEGIVGFIPEFRALIHELNRLSLESWRVFEEKLAFALEKLPPPSLKCFESLPSQIQSQLLLDRDPHGNVQVSKIETERLLISAVKEELIDRKSLGKYKGKFSAQPVFLGYEGRSSFPSNFDSHYCYNLGVVSTLLVSSRANGYLSALSHLSSSVEEWEPKGVPLVSMIHLEEKNGGLMPMIQKALVELKKKPFSTFKEMRKKWALEDDFRYPGPIQFFGPTELSDCINITLREEFT